MDAPLALYPWEPIPSVSEHILKEIKSEAIWVRIQYAAEDICKVQFAKAETRVYRQDVFFTITLADEVPRNKRILLLFPEHKSVLDLSKTRDLADINQFIDKHASKDPKLPQLVMCLGDVLYKVEGVTGRIYLHWAQLIEHVAGRQPSRWEDAPLIASTDGHFVMTGLFPVYGQHKLQSFIHPGSLRFYLPKGFVAWSLDERIKVAKVEKEAMKAHTVVARAQRDMVPDHEMDKYTSRTYLPKRQGASRSVGERSETESETEQKAVGPGDSTVSEEYESVDVTINPEPTPRPWAPSDAVSAVLGSGFFDLDPTTQAAPPPSQPQPARAKASSPPPPRGTQHSRSLRDDDLVELENYLNAPLLPLFSSPTDRKARKGK